tara:strand:+ start:662 stop:1687 length:1026 start_codon:yes stop_codon:yes gene_type:complete
MKEILIFLIGFLSIKTLSDAGSFKVIESHYDGSCVEIHNISGPEDITILSNGVALISSDNRRLTLEGSPEQGHIFSYNLNNKSSKLEKLTNNLEFEFHPHGISVYESNDKTILFVVNHRKNKNTIEVFNLVNNSLVFKKTIESDLLNSPNDIVAINENEFYVTNDHGNSSIFGKMIEDYLQLSKSNIIFFNGKKFKVVIDKLQYANGINVNNNKTKVFVAETIGKSVSIYNRNTASNDLSLQQKIYLDSGVDNIELDNQENLWIGSHPQVLKFVKHAKNKEYDSPSQVIKLIKKPSNQYAINEVYLDNGSMYSGSSVAAVYKDILLIGSVFEDYFLFCQNN